MEFTFPSSIFNHSENPSIFSNKEQRKKKVNPTRSYLTNIKQTSHSQKPIKKIFFFFISIAHVFLEITSSIAGERDRGEKKNLKALKSEGHA